MRRLNLRFTAGMLVVGVVLGFGVHLLHGYQVRRNAQMFLREAERAKEEGKKPDAVRNYGRYLAFAPDDVDVLADLGLLLADISVDQPRMGRPAYETLERALRLDPTRMDLRRRLVSVAVDIGRHRDAHEHLVSHLLPASPKDPELLLLLARCKEQMGHYADSAKSYQEVIGLAPDRLEAYARLAGLLRHRMENPKEADAVMQKMVAANEKSCEAHVQYGRHLRTTRLRDDTARLNQAAAEAAIALKLAPEDADALYLAAQCALDKKEYDQARTYATQVVKLHPKFAAIYSLLADVEVRTNRRSEAVARLEEGIKAVPNEPDLVWRLCSLLLDDGKVDQAKAMLGRLREAKYPEPLIAYLNSRMEYVQEAWLKASRSFERIRPDLTAYPDVVKLVDFWLGGCYRRLGNADQQLTAYRRAVSVDPFWIPARVGVASALLSMRRIEEAQEEYREIARLGGNPAAAILDLAQLEILRNLWLNRTERNWAEAERLLSVAEKAIAEKKIPDNPRIPVLRAEVLVAQDRAAQAEKIIQDARTKNPAEITFHLALASLAQRDKNWDAAEKYFDEAQKACGDGAALRLARAQYFAQRFGKEAADRIRKLAEGTDRLTKEDRTNLGRGLAAASLQVGDYDQTRRLCQQVSEGEPHNLQIRLLLFDLALRADDASGLEKVLGQIHEIEGDGPYWHYGSALNLSLKAKDDKRPLDSAQEHLAKCRTLRPGWSRVPFLAAELSMRQGNEDLAVDHYLRAIELGERSPRAIRRVVQLLAQRQRFIEADKVLRRLEEQQSPFSNDLSRVASEVSLRLDDFDRALEMAKQAAKDSKEYRDHIWLGQVLSVLGQRARAEKRDAEAAQRWGEAENELRQAVALANNAADAWVALVQFLARTDQKPKAEQAIAEAQKRIPVEQAPLALAQCYEVMHDPKIADRKYLDLAEKKYLEAVAAAPANVTIVRQLSEFYLRTGKGLEAETHLNKIAKGEIEADEATVVWARRALALILAGRGNYDSLKVGLELIERNLESSNAAIYDQRAKALLLSSHPERKEREKAAEILERVLQQPRVATADDRFVLAKLYLTQGPSKWGQAARHFRTLVGSAANDPRYIATYGTALLGRQEIDEADQYIRVLEKLTPNQLSTVILRAQVQCERGQCDAAIASLKAYLDKPESQGEDRATRIGLVAATLENLGRRLMNPDQKKAKKLPAEELEKQKLAAGKFATEAEKLYREYAKKGPQQTMLLADYLARHKRMDEAIALAEKAWPNSKPELIAPTMLSLLSGGGPDSPPDGRAEKILRAAIDKHQRPISFLTLLADYCSLHNRCEEAEAIYREILQKSPNHILALNNLAVLLAMQNKKLEEAEQLVNRAIELTGPAVNSLDSRALVYLARGKLNEALADVETVIADSPVAMAYFRRAQIHAALKRPEEARQSLAEAQKKGLKAELLHPLERPSYEKLCKAIL